MNSCLQKPCRLGFAYLDNDQFRYQLDHSGAFRYIQEVKLLITYENYLINIIILKYLYSSSLIYIIQSDWLLYLISNDRYSNNYKLISTKAIILLPLNFYELA